MLKNCSQTLVGIILNGFRLLMNLNSPKKYTNLSLIGGVIWNRLGLPSLILILLKFGDKMINYDTHYVSQTNAKDLPTTLLSYKED